MTEEVVSYKCKWCGELYEIQSAAAECAFRHAKEKLANAMLEEGYTLESINYRCGFLWNLKDEQKGITKESCFIISHWQCCNKPAYKIVKISANGGLRLWGKGSWSSGYGDWVSLDRLPTPHPKESLFVDDRRF